MNNNKLSAMLQANKVSTILAMMGYQVTVGIYKECCVKEIEVTVYYDNSTEKTQIIKTIIKNMQDSDNYKSRESKSTQWITYTITWKE